MRAEGHESCSHKSDTFRLLFDSIGYDTDLSLHEAGFEIDFALIDHALLEIEAFQLLWCHLFRSQSVSLGSDIRPANAKARHSLDIGHTPVFGQGEHLASVELQQKFVPDTAERMSEIVRVGVCSHDIAEPVARIPVLFITRSKYPDQV